MAAWITRHQRWSPGHKAEAKDTKKFQGQGQTLSRPWHRRKCSPKKRRFSKKFFKQSQKKVFKKFFYAKKVFKNFFSGDFHLTKTKQGLRKFSARFLALSNKISTVQKIVLSSSRKQGNFQGLEASTPRTSKSVLVDVLENFTSARHVSSANTGSLGVVFKGLHMSFIYEIALKQ